MAKRLRTTSALAVVVMILVGACSSSSSTPTAGASAPTSAPPASAPAASAPAASAPAASAPASLAVPAVPTGYTELDKALTKGSDGKLPYDGKTVSIQTQWIGGEGTNFAAAVADFAKASGIKIQIDSIGSSHETVLKTRIDGGKPPDLAMLAQPTPVLQYAAAGKVIDVASFMAPKVSTDHAATIGLVTQGDKIWGIPYKADVKSTIWYPIKAFEAKGYKVPTTWEELIALSDKIVADGSNPWCVSAGGPGTATGWQLTDWVEEIVLKTKGMDYWNDWISHKVPFSDPGIKDALDKYVAKILFTPNYVFGTNTNIVNQDQKTVMDPMFTDDLANPKCWMQKIPTWYGPDFFPDQRASAKPSKYVVGTDVGIFPFPTIDPNQKNAEGSADTLMVLADRPEVRAVAEFLATPEGIQNWIRAGSAISTNTTTPADWYAGAYKLKVAADIANSASGLGFDASDLMPAKVGAGTFWTKMDEWVNNNGANTDAILKAIDDSWPAQ